MKIAICLDKEDIHTHLYGHNYIIETNGITITFTPEAIQEFLDDIQGIRQRVAKLEPCQDPNCTHETPTNQQLSN